MRLNDIITEELLQEAREDYIAKSMGPKIMAALEKDRSQYKPDTDDPLRVVRRMAEKTDPKKIQWVARQYARGSFIWEDLSQIKKTLEEFDRVKSKLEKKDINQYKTMSQLYDALEPFQDQEVKSKRQEDKEETQKLFDTGEAEMFYRGKDFSIVIPKTREASCELGKGTKWCTASTDTISDNFFDDYNKDGPLYIIRMKNGPKYQLHITEHDGDVMFMDERDEEVDLGQFSQKHPEMYEAFAKQAKKFGVVELTDPKTIDVQKMYELVYTVPSNIVHFQDKAPDRLVHFAIDKEPTVIALYKGKDQTDRMKWTAIRSENFRGMDLNHVKNPTDDMIDHAIKNSVGGIRFITKLPKETLIWMLENKPNELMYYAGTYPDDLTPEQIRKLIKIYPQAFYRLKATDDSVDALLEIQPSLIGDINDEWLTPERIWRSLKAAPRAITRIPAEKRTEKMWVYALQHEPQLLSSIPERFQTDAIINAAVTANPTVVWAVANKEKRQAIMDKQNLSKGTEWQ